MGDGSSHFVQEFVAGWFGGERIRLPSVVYLLTVVRSAFRSGGPVSRTSVRHDQGELVS